MKRNPKRDKAWKYYLKNKGSATLKAIAKKFGVAESTIRRWKKEDGWDDNEPVVASKKSSQSKSENKKHSTVEYEIVPSAGLNDKQMLFCMHYVKCWNATKSYQKAYECDYRTAHANAHRMMANDGIKSEIDRLKRALRESVMIDARHILQKYLDIAFADIKDYMAFGTEVIHVPVVKKGEPVLDEDGNPTYEAVKYQYMELKNDVDVDGTIITSIKKTKEGIAVTLADRMEALAVLLRYEDVFDENTMKRLREQKLRVEIEAEKAKVW